MKQGSVTGIHVCHTWNDSLVSLFPGEFELKNEIVVFDHLVYHNKIIKFPSPLYRTTASSSQMCFHSERNKQNIIYLIRRATRCDLEFSEM